MKTFVIIATNGQSLINFRGVFIRELVDMGLRVICVSIEPPEEMEDAIKALGAEYYQIAGDRIGIGIFSGFRMISEYRKFLEKIKPEYCFLYMSKPIAFGGVAAIKAKVPHINMLVNGLENAYYRTTFKDWLVRQVMTNSYRKVGRHADNVFFQNSRDMAYFQQHGMLSANNGHLVGGSGVDMEYFSRQPLPQEPVILMTARLLWSKGIREFAGAIRIVKSKHPGIKVLLVGGLDDNDEAMSAQELDKFIKENDVEYCGFSQDVRSYLKRCSIFVLPSYHEGMPRSILEAMATGRPIITTDAPGCSETVVNELNGFIVPVRNTGMLAEKINTLIANSSLREHMADESYKLCKERFEVHGVNQSMFKLMFK